MGKSVILLSFLGIAILLVGCLLAPESSAFWLANKSEHFMFIRLGLLVSLGALLITNPPRNVVLRTVIGFIATGVGVWAATATYQNHMQILDSMTILAAAISSGIAVLEYIPEYDDEVAAPPSTISTTGAKA